MTIIDESMGYEDYADIGIVLPWDFPTPEVPEVSPWVGWAMGLGAVLTVAGLGMMAMGK